MLQPHTRPSLPCSVAPRRGDAAAWRRRADAAVAAATSRSAPPPASWATRPLLAVETVEGAPERCSGAVWPTFCGAAAGVWAGSLVAASPFTGALEAVALDERDKPTLTSAFTRRRASGGGKTAGEDSLADIQFWAPCPLGAPFPDASAFEALDSRVMHNDSPGLVVLEDGSFSDGPSSLLPPPPPPPPAEGEGVDPDAPPGDATGARSSFSVVFRWFLTRFLLYILGVVRVVHCLCVGGRERVTVEHTLHLSRAGGGGAGANSPASAAADNDGSDDEAGDIVLAQLRVRAWREVWAGPSGGPAAAAAAAASATGDAHPAPPVGAAAASAACPALAERARVAPKCATDGEWRVFVRAAAPLSASSSSTQPDAAAASASARSDACAVMPPSPPPPSHTLLPPSPTMPLKDPISMSPPPQNVPDDPAPGPRFIHTAYTATRSFAVRPGRPYPAACGASVAAASDPPRDEEGATLWLPGGITATLHLGTGPERDGVTVGAGWWETKEGGGGGGAAAGGAGGAAAASEAASEAVGFTSWERSYDGRGRFVGASHAAGARPGAGRRRG